MDQYSGLNRAQLSYEYLHTNSTTHEFLFGALAELLDNARDANATKMEVFSIEDDKVRGGYILCFLDNGEGMDPAEANGVITFGRSNKRVMDSKMIGQYGNGLKSGAMRIANDFILFTKKNETMSCVFMSRTFHEEENLHEVIVPLPSFDAKTAKPYCCNTAAAKYRYNAEMNLILKYSPFKTQEEFLQQFERISGDTGTIVMVYNMKLLDSGEPELVIEHETADVLLNSNEQERELMMSERWSFRAYTSVLYANPYMKVYIESKKVRTKLLHHSLYKPRLYKFASTRFKERSKKEAQKAQHDAQVAEMRAKEAESKARQLEKTVFTSQDKNIRSKLRKAQDLAEELREDATVRKKYAAKKQKDEKLPKVLDFVFGLNLERRTHDGVFVYNCSRLIKMYQKVGPQQEGGLNCSGVVGIVDVPYQVLEPTHNKQDFADAKEYRHLLKTLGDHMSQYWKDVEIAKQGVTQFWEFYGYLGNKWQSPPSSESKFMRRRAMQTEFYLQCDNCLKWRVIPFSSTNITRDFPDEWTCNMNADHSRNSCSAVEQKMNFSEGRLENQPKSKEEIHDDLQKKMERIKSKLKQVEKKNDSKVTSSSQSSKKRHSIQPEPEVSYEPKKRVPAKTASPVKNTTSKPKLKPKEIDRKRKSEPIVRSVRKLKDEPIAKPKRPPVKDEPIARPKRPPPVAKKSECDTSQPSDLDMSDSQVSTITRVRTKRGVQGKINQIDLKDSEDNSSEPEAVVESSVPSRSNRTESRSSKKPEPVKKKVDKMKATSTSSPPIENDSNDVEPVKKKKRVVEVNDDSTDEETSTKDAVDDVVIGTKVEMLMKGKWQPAKVIGLRPCKRVKVKFDHSPDSKFDKIVSLSSSQIRIKDTTASEPSEVPSSSTSAVSPQPIANGGISTSSDKPIIDKKPDESNEKSEGSELTAVSNSYRNCLKYFLPPQWVMSKDDIGKLSFKELANFPLNDFVDHYEGGIKKVIENFQDEVETQKKECELEQSKRSEAEKDLAVATNKLSSLRKRIAKLLKSIHEEFDIDPNDDTDKVDELVTACIEQLP